MDIIKNALDELKKLEESNNDFDNKWKEKFGPDDTVAMTTEQFFKELEEMRDFNESK